MDIIVSKAGSRLCFTAALLLPLEYATVAVLVAVIVTATSCHGFPFLESEFHVQILILTFDI